MVVLRNYIIPGLESRLIEDRGEQGRVREFHMTRTQLGDIAPHSHRFDFTAIVKKGTVRNILWTEEPAGQLFAVSHLDYQGTPGSYVKTFHRDAHYEPEQFTYRAGDTYRMASHEIHHIRFSEGAIVEVTEGPQVTRRTTVLEPIVANEVIPIMRVEPWMFRRA